MFDMSACGCVKEMERKTLSVFTRIHKSHSVEGNLI